MFLWSARKKGSGYENGPEPLNTGTLGTRLIPILFLREIFWVRCAMVDACRYLATRYNQDGGRNSLRFQNYFR